MAWEKTDNATWLRNNTELARTDTAAEEKYEIEKARAHLVPLGMHVFWCGFEHIMMLDYILEEKKEKTHPKQWSNKNAQNERTNKLR